MSKREFLFVLAAWSSCAICTVAQPVDSLIQAGAVHPVSRDVLVEAMRNEQGYDVTVTSNGVRFQAGVLLYLARHALNQDSLDGPLLIDSGDYFHAYLERTGISEDDAPTFVRLPYAHGTFLLIEYRPDRVVKEVRRGATPELAMNVKAFWPDGPGVPTHYSYVDTLADPDLRVRHDRVTTFRLLAFDDMIVHDEIDGIHGRADSGVLGVIFDLIGQGHARHSRAAIAADSWQVVRATAQKGFIKIPQTVSVAPDGTAHMGIYQDRADLSALEKRLKRSLKIDYVRWSP